MRIAEFYSHQNGYEWLRCRSSSLALSPRRAMHFEVATLTLFDQ